MDNAGKKDWIKIEELVLWVLLMLGMLAVSGLTMLAVQVMLTVGPDSFSFYVGLTGLVLMWTKLIARLAKDA